MNSKTTQQFDQLYAIFKTREQELSQEVRCKLAYIASRIHGRPFRASELLSFQQQDIEDLQNLDCHSLAVIFNTLVKSLLLQNKIWEKQCRIKYSGFFESWKNAKLTTDPKYLSICNGKICSKYDLKMMSVSNCRKTKKSFELHFKNKQLIQAKFSSFQMFNEALAHIQHCIDQTRGIQTERNRPEQIKGSNPTLMMQEQSFERDRSFSSSLQEASSCIRSVEEIDSPPKCQEQKGSPLKSEQEFSSPSKSRLSSQQDYESNKTPVGYRIVEEDEHLVMCINDNQAKLYTSLQLQTNSSLDKLICYYTQQKEWNTIIAQEIIKDQSPNVFEVFRLFKKNGTMFQKQRATLTRLEVNCTKNSATVEQQSLEQGISHEYTNCYIKTTTKFRRCMGAVRIVIDCQFNGKGYYQVQDSSAMLLNMFKELKFFQNSFKIYQLQKSKPKVFIEPFLSKEETSPRKLFRQPQNKTNLVQEGTLKKEVSSQEEGSKVVDKANGDLPKTDDSLDLPNKNQLTRAQLMNKLRPLSPQNKINLDYVKLVMDLQNQRGYLRHRFQQKILMKYDDYTPPYSLQQMLQRGGEYRITDNKELVFINQDLLNSQKDTLLFVIKQIGANIFSGKSVLNVSLPVDIFESRSLIERSAASFGRIPDFLLPIADQNPIYQIKKIVAFIATIPTLQLLMQKPFNPILGETFQAYIKGIPIYYQQISHHPPISAYYMTCPQFTLYGNLVAFADVSFNSAVGGNEGIMHIILRNGSHFQCYFPPSEISGLIFGDRKFRGYGKGFVLEKKQELFAEFSIQKAKKGLYDKGQQKLSPGDIIGGIFRVTKQFVQKVAHEPSLRKFDGLSKKDVVEKLGSIRGVWFQDIVMDGEVMNQNVKIYPLQYARVALPSDANFRADILFHKLGDLPESQRMKQVLEIKQRGDRKLRQKWAKASKKRI